MEEKVKEKGEGNKPTNGRERGWGERGQRVGVKERKAKGKRVRGKNRVKLRERCGITKGEITGTGRGKGEGKGNEKGMGYVQLRATEMGI